MQNPYGMKIAPVVCRVGDGMRQMKLKAARCEGDRMKVWSEEWMIGVGRRSFAFTSSEREELRRPSQGQSHPTSRRVMERGSFLKRAVVGCSKPY